MPAIGCKISITFSPAALKIRERTFAQNCAKPHRGMIRIVDIASTIMAGKVLDPDRLAIFQKKAVTQLTEATREAHKIDMRVSVRFSVTELTIKCYTERRRLTFCGQFSFGGDGVLACVGYNPAL